MIRTNVAIDSPGVEEPRRPKLRIFAELPDTANTSTERPVASSAPPLLSRESTLTEFADRFFFPVCREAAGSRNGTLRLDRQVLGLWKMYTGDPPIGQIDDLMCGAFVAELRKRPGVKGKPQLSPNTVRKLCTHLQTILDHAGPRSRRNRLGQGLLADVPYLERPKKRRKEARDNFTLNEIGAWLDHCGEAAHAANLLGLDPCLWWKGIVTFIYNTGLRIDTTMRLEWSMLDRDEPDWLAIPAEIYKGGEHGLDMYVNSHARAAIEAIGSRKHGRIFPWHGWPESQGWLQAQRRSLLSLAGIPEHRRFGFHGLRKALSTWIAPQNWMLSKIVLGHSTNDVTKECYVNPDVMREILTRVPQPGKLRQKALFDK